MWQNRMNILATTLDRGTKCFEGMLYATFRALNQQPLSVMLSNLNICELGYYRCRYPGYEE